MDFLAAKMADESEENVAETEREHAVFFEKYDSGGYGYIEHQRGEARLGAKIDLLAAGIKHRADHHECD